MHDALNDAGADGIPLYSYSRAAIQSTHWDHDEENSRQVLEDWFIPGALEKIAGRERIEDHWDRLFFGTVYIWRGKNGRIDIAGHPYIKQMYPFITVGRADKDELQRFHGDRRVYLLSLFNEWAALLCGDDLKTAFSLERCVITSEYTHAAGLFQFSDIAVGGKPYKKFYLHREMIVGRSGDSVYTVMVGIPQPTLKDTEYHKHVHSWLKAFQLGREREVF
ncbi:MAG: hypothetical protein JWL84_6041 [Rhodospirillales bacterium]|nr:hypothetical protein [Rhodospirillales bacterium]